MQRSVDQRSVTAAAVLGVLLMVVGAAALLFRTVGVDLFEAVGEWGWPLFIIVPGLVLLAASLFPTRPNGVGFAIAGSIVTTVGLLLAYQWQSGHWESWAYAWALIPAAAGLAQVVYGAFAGEGSMINRGLWMAGISALMFGVGAWFFEGIFAGEPRPEPFDFWPVALIVLGGLIAFRAFVLPGDGHRDRGTAPPPSQPGSGTREPLVLPEPPFVTPEPTSTLERPVPPAHPAGTSGRATVPAARPPRPEACHDHLRRRRRGRNAEASPGADNARMAATTAPRSTGLRDDELELLDAYWRAANYLSVGQIYLLDNPLLREPLKAEHVKPRLLGHWGTTPGLNLIYAHLNRAIRARDLSAIYITGPGHGGPGLVANAYLEGTWSEIYPKVTPDEAGLQKLFRQFSFPGGIPSHVAAEVPGSIHEGGELGYSLAHAFGAAFDNPDLLVACVVGDGEAETGPLATSWHSNKFLDPARDGAVLPILQLNGYKIANPTVLDRIPQDELASLMEGYGYRVLVVEGDDPPLVHRAFAEALDVALDEITAIQAEARKGGDGRRRSDGTDVAAADARDGTRSIVERPADARPRWPMIILRTPKGWTGPEEVDGLPVEGTWRSHQVPVSNARQDDEHRKILEDWLRSYRPEELFDERGRLVPALAELAPRGDRRMSANPHANGGLLLRDLELPDFRQYAVTVDAPGTQYAEATRVLGAFLRDVIRSNPSTFRLFGPDETESNRLGAVFEASDKTWNAEIVGTDEHLAPEGRVMEVLSEHLCQGWLEGYLLTGRHGLFNCYEAFIHIVDSMFNQHAKWLKVTRDLDWRKPVASLNYLLSSHVWRQDHNGFSHQDPGFIDHVMNKKAEVIRVYLPPDANTLLSVADHCLRSRNYVNVIVAGKQPALQWLSMDQAVVHATRGAGIWEFASNDDGGEPDVVMGCAGDIPTLETLAAVDLLRQHLPDLKVRVVNVVDLMRLQDSAEHPHGMTHAEFDALFTTDRPIVFAYHGYPWLIHRLTYRRTNHANLHVRGYKEEGTTTTPFDMVMLNDLDRYHLVMDVIDRVPQLADRAGHVRQKMVDARLRARQYTRDHGEDIPEVRDWTWGRR